MKHEGTGCQHKGKRSSQNEVWHFIIRVEGLEQQTMLYSRHASASPTVRTIAAGRCCARGLPQMVPMEVLQRRWLFVLWRDQFHSPLQDCLKKALLPRFIKVLEGFVVLQIYCSVLLSTSIKKMVLKSHLRSAGDKVWCWSGGGRILVRGESWLQSFASFFVSIFWFKVLINPQKCEQRF